MKVPAGRADAFAAAPPEDLRGILIYGPDLGLVRERAEAELAKLRLELARLQNINRRTALD